MDERPPFSCQAKPKKTKKIAKKAKKKSAKGRAPRVKKNLNEPYIWLLKQLKDNSDPELNMQRSSALLENTLNVLEAKEGVNNNQVLRFLEKVKTDMNLKEVMQYFKIRRDKKK